MCSLYLKRVKIINSYLGQNTINLLFHLGVPLITSGFLCLILLKYGIVYLISPSMLVFYGIALISASKFTFGEIKFLEILEITLGLLGCLFVGYGLVLRAVGFGILHIIYGVEVLNKYKLALIENLNKDFETECV